MFIHGLQCPTTIVPFFGDQFFWGERIHQRGLGPAPIPIDKLSVEALSDAINVMLQPEVRNICLFIGVFLKQFLGYKIANVYCIVLCILKYTLVY